MRTLILFGIIFISFSSFAKDIVIEDGRRKFQISTTEEKIIYKDELTSLTMSKQACNVHIMERLKKRLDKYFKRPFLEDSRPEFIKLKVDGKPYFEPRFGERALFLLSLPDEIKKLKIEEDLNCAKN